MQRSKYKSSEHINAPWAPCTCGRDVQSYLRHLNLPATFSDIKHQWILLGRPQLQSFANLAIDDLDHVEEGQLNSLYFAIDAHCIGIDLQKRSFNDVAAYIHNRAVLKAELTVRESGWNDEVKERLSNAYWRQSLAEFDLDRASCQLSDRHDCLLDVIWGEIATIPTEEILTRYQQLYHSSLGISTFADWSPMTASSSATADTFASESSWNQQPQPEAAIFDDSAHSMADFRDVSPASTESDFRYPLRALDLSCGQNLASDSKGNDFLFADAFISFPEENLHINNSKLIAEPKQINSNMNVVAPKPKRPEMHRRAISDGRIRSTVKSKSSAGPRLSYLADMACRFEDTYKRYERHSGIKPEMHYRLGQIFHQTDDMLIRLSCIARLLAQCPSDSTTMSPRDSTEVWKMSAKAIQEYPIMSDVRYQHALLDTWHLYRSRWRDLIREEQTLRDVNSNVDASISRLIDTLKLST